MQSDVGLGTIGGSLLITLELSRSFASRRGFVGRFRVLGKSQFDPGLTLAAVAKIRCYDIYIYIFYFSYLCFLFFFFFSKINLKNTKSMEEEGRLKTRSRAMIPI